MEKLARESMKTKVQNSPNREERVHQQNELNPKANDIETSVRPQELAPVEIDLDDKEISEPCLVFNKTELNPNTSDIEESTPASAKPQETVSSEFDMEEKEISESCPVFNKNELSPKTSDIADSTRVSVKAQETVPSDLDLEEKEISELYPVLNSMTTAIEEQFLPSFDDLSEDDSLPSLPPIPMSVEERRTLRAIEAPPSPEFLPVILPQARPNAIYAGRRGLKSRLRKMVGQTREQNMAAMNL